MVQPLYVPVLPTRRGAVKAYERLAPDIRRRIAPLWTVVPHTGAERTRGASPPLHPDNDGRELHRRLTPRIDRLIASMDGMPGWADAAHVEGEVHGAAVALWRLATRSRLTLVTGPERHPTLQRYAADLAFAAGRGLGIRVLIDEPPDEPRSTEMLDLVARLCTPPSQLDLILDVGEVNDVSEAGKKSVVALDLLGTLLPWRRVVLVAGAFPRAAESPDAHSTFMSDRRDWALHAWVRATRPQSAVVYGDYSVEHVLSANVPADDSGQHGPPWSLLRYTLPGHFLVARAPTRGAERADRVRAMARWIVEHESFRREPGPHRSLAEEWLESCAHGTGPVGTGTAETWIREGHVQHLTYVTRCLTNSPPNCLPQGDQRPDRLAGGGGPR